MSGGRAAPADAVGTAIRVVHSTVMPRYFFDLYNGLVEAIDEEGLSLADAEAAWAEGVVNIRSILSAEIMDGVLDLTGRLDVRDERGGVFTIPFAEAVELRLGVSQR